MTCFRTGDVDWLDFWEKAKSEPWGRQHAIIYENLFFWCLLFSETAGRDRLLCNLTGDTLRIHPVQDWPEADRAKAVAVSLHGDERTGKRSRTTMIISWSPLAIHEPSMVSKYPFVVPVLFVLSARLFRSWDIYIYIPKICIYATRIEREREREREPHIYSVYIWVHRL